MLAIETTDNLTLDPNELLPIVAIPSTSPSTYPSPPVAIVAATATPLLTVISAVALPPLEVTFVNGTLVKTYPAARGVSPIPALIILRVPVAIPAVFT